LLRHSLAPKIHRAEKRFVFHRTHCDFGISPKRANTVLKHPAFFGQADGLQRAKLCGNAGILKKRFMWSLCNRSA